MDAVLIKVQLFSLDADDFTLVSDKLTWADCCALAAVCTLIIIDVSEEVIHVDSVEFTVLYAERTTDAADVTHREVQRPYCGCCSLRIRPDRRKRY